MLVGAPKDVTYPHFVVSRDGWFCFVAFAADA